jgi:hypothetical protein
VCGFVAVKTDRIYCVLDGFRSQVDHF